MTYLLMSSVSRRYGICTFFNQSPWNTGEVKRRPKSNFDRLLSKPKMKIFCFVCLSMNYMQSFCKRLHDTTVSLLIAGILI